MAGHGHQEGVDDAICALASPATILDNLDRQGHAVVEQGGDGPQIAGSDFFRQHPGQFGRVAGQGGKFKAVFDDKILKSDGAGQAHPVTGLVQAPADSNVRLDIAPGAVSKNGDA